MNLNQDNAALSVLKHYDLGNVIDIKPLKIGFINDSLIVTVDGTPQKRYFLQRINTNIFRDPEMLQSNIKKVTDHIRAKMQAQGADDIERRVMRIVPTVDGKLFCTDADGNAWRIYDFIEGSHSLDDINADTAYLAGRAFGEFQDMLSDLPAEELGETIPSFHDMEFRLLEFRQAVANDKAGRASQPEAQMFIAEIEKRADEMCKPERLYREGKMPKRICHCDAKVNNMLLDANDHPLAIVDLDTVMPSFVMSDMGDFMRTGANTGAEDDENLDNISIDMAVYDAFRKGYFEKATYLTDIEREMLDYSGDRLAYMQTIRFFGDYLNGDTYYKIKSPEHNLQRTRAQFRLLQAFEALHNK